MADGRVTIDIILDEKGAVKGIKGLEDSFNGVGKKANSLGDTFKGMLTGLGVFKLVSGGLSLISSSVGSAIKRFDTLNNSTRVFENMGFSAEETAGMMENLNTSIAGLPTPIDSAISGVQLLVGSVGNLDKSQQIFAALNNGILGFGGNTEQVQNAVTQLSQSFSNGKVDAETWNSMIDSGLGPALNALAKQMGMTSGELKKGLSDGTVSVETFQDALIDLNKNGGGGLASLEKIAKDSTAGISTGIANAKTAVTRGVAGIVEAIDNALKGADLGGIGGVIAAVGTGFENALKYVAGFVPVIGQVFAAITSSTAFQSLIDVIGMAIDKFKELATAFLDSQAFETIKAAAEEFGQALLDIDFVAIIQQVGEFVDKWGPLIAIIGGAVIAFQVLSGVIPVLVAAFNGFKIIMTLIKAVGFLQTAFTFLAPLFGTISIIIASINWPIVLAAAAISLLVAAGIALYKNWDTVKAKAMEIWGAISAFFTEVGTRIKTKFTEDWNQIVEFFSTTWTFIVDMATSIWTGIVTFFSGIWSTIVTSATNDWNELVAFLVGIWTSIVGFATPIFAAIGAFFASVWEGIKIATGLVWEGIKTILFVAVGAIYFIIYKPLEMIALFIFSVWQRVAAATVAAWTSISTAISTAWTTISTIVVTYATAIWNSIVIVFNAVLATIVTVWTTITTAIATAWTAIYTSVSSVLTQVWTVISSVFMTVYNFMLTTMQGILAFYISVWTSIYSAISSVLSQIWAVISSIFNQVAAFISAVWTTISNAIMTAWNVIYSTVTAAVNRVLSIIMAVFNTVKSFITSVWNTIKSIIMTAWSNIYNNVTSNVNLIRSIVTSVFNAVKSIITNIWNSIKSTTTSVWNSIKNSVTNIINNIKSTFSNIFNSLRSIVSNAFNNVKSAVSTGMSNAYNAVTEYISKFYDAGKNIIGSIVDGITSKVGAIKDAAGNIAGTIRDFFPFSPAKRGPLKKLHKTDFGWALTTAIGNSKNKVTKSFNDLMTIPDLNTPGGLNTSLNGTMTLPSTVRAMPTPNNPAYSSKSYEPKNSSKTIQNDNGVTINIANIENNTDQDIPQVLEEAAWIMERERKRLDG